MGRAASFANAFVSPQRYVDSVRRDLSWLLKTEVSRPADTLLRDSLPLEAGGEDGSFEENAPSLADFPQAAASVVAYGVPVMKGEYGLRVTSEELRRSVEQAIRVFEKRINPRTLKVRLAADAAGSDGGTVSIFGFDIECDVIMRPLPEHLVLRAYYSPAFAQWRLEGSGHGT